MTHQPGEPSGGEVSVGDALERLADLYDAEEDEIVEVLDAEFSRAATDARDGPGELKGTAERESGIDGMSAAEVLLALGDRQTEE